jgi:lipoprotein-anchoring transpeptidase ErfK/SrfK
MKTEPFTPEGVMGVRAERYERVHRRAGKRRAVALPYLLGWLCLAGAVSLAAACEGAVRPAAPGASRPAAALSISPADGSREVKTSAPVVVTPAYATVTSITVTSGGVPVEGHASQGGRVWRSRWALHTSSDYTVIATGRSTSGKAVHATSSFRTLTPSATIGARIFEGYRQTYGVGMPVILTFSRPVSRHAAVERALRVTTSKPVVGAWYWDGDQTLYFRPRAYWPPGTRVSITGHFDGIQAAPGVYATADLTQDFRIGPSLIVTVSSRTHYMKVWYRRHLIGNWPVSTGRPGHDTANGTYLTIEKGNPTRMVGDGYDLLVPYAVRFTWSGNYIHGAAWSLAQQGVVNVSHGCVNLSPAHAATYYSLARAGDPVTVTDSPAEGTFGNGWTVWFLDWPQLVGGSALGEAIEAGPGGSRPVPLSSLGPWSPSPPLQGPGSGNYRAG